MRVPWRRAASMASRATAGVVADSAAKIPPVWNQHSAAVLIFRFLIGRLVASELCLGVRLETRLAPISMLRRSASGVVGVINPRHLELSRVSGRLVIACERQKGLGSQREPTRGM